MKKRLNFITKNFVIKTFAVLMIIGMMDSLAFSQTRIRFAKGRSSTTISGTLAGNSSRSYVLGAKRNQYMLVRIDSRGSFSVEIDGNYAGNGDLYELQTTGDHTIIVNNEGGSSSRYSMYVEIR